jgi:hypothetical protein
MWIEKPMILKLYQIEKKLESNRMGKQTFDKIKKTLAILLAVFLVVTLTAASASACASKNVKNVKSNLPNKLVSNTDANGLTEEQKTALGNQLLDMADNNWFGNDWGNDRGNDWGNDWGNGCDSCDNGVGDNWFGNDW